MKKDSSAPTSQDYDRKQKQDHALHNPRAVKDIPTSQDKEATPERGEKGHVIPEKLSPKANHTMDERKLIRQENTHHFTNRARPENK